MPGEKQRLFIDYTWKGRGFAAKKPVEARCHAYRCPDSHGKHSSTHHGIFFLT